MRNILVDTGAIVALLRGGSDRLHEGAKRFFSELLPQDTLYTTWPVITECAFLLRHRESVFWEWLLESGMEISDFTLHDIQTMRRWRAGYADREIDFADASLVWLANKLGANMIATTDFADFETYRISGKKAFKMMIKRN
jgi:predicted nucleic acid-binding protein